MVAKVIVWADTYATRQYVLIGTTLAVAQQWAEANSRGWRVAGVAAVRGRPENFTVTLKRR